MTKKVTKGDHYNHIYSLWVNNWTKAYLIRKDSIWTVKEKTQTGSWLWKKILSCQEVAKQCYKVEVKDEKKASFWYESWFVWDI